MERDRYDDESTGKPAGREPDLFEQFDQEPGGEQATQAGKTGTTDELRYEGPIRFEEETVSQRADESGSGRTIATAALIGGAVIVIVGVALFLREPGDADDPLALLDDPVPVEAPFDQGTDPANEGSLLAQSAEPLLPGMADAEGELREVPAETGTALPSSAPRTSPPPERIEREPAPSAAAQPTQRLAEAPAAPARTFGQDDPVAALTAGLRELVSAGRHGEAARMARERAQFAPGGSWTLQVLFACEGSTVDNAFSDGGDRKLMLFPANSGGAACYRLTWGVFPSRDAALAQAGGIPARFRGEKPVPLALSKAAGL